MDPRYKAVTSQKEVRAGRSFDPDEFALEQVVDGTAPEDYTEPKKSFSHTCSTLAKIISGGP